ncbi:hypothetical protein Q3O98_12015 [Ralstonia pseudosolanacearum]|uniref:hypothetical protein n=1 Tax=Ralstonia pseudosolanacearum TaxID=1310165 RepID=UPI002675CA36|nr:hypothetical protein [Ralstonia pseudosolanacearum]MDO3621826.1 hypothetical protein [Ralstonia pseudosolanacearum]
MSPTSPQDLIDRARQGQQLTEAESLALHEALSAAMFKRLGRKTKISRGGYSIVLAAPAAGHRSDLPEESAAALAWLDANSVATTGITAADVEAYRAWWAPVYQARRIGQAKFLITAPFNVRRGSELVPANRVALIDGWGQAVAEHVVRRPGRYSRDAVNTMGEAGAYCTVQNVAEVERHIETMRSRHPEFAGACVQNNDNTPRR